MSEPTFGSDVVDAILRHMNGDHTDDNLLIARAFGVPAASDATMTGLDEHGGTWAVTEGETQSELVVPWSETLTERAQVRREVVRLYTEACERLGVTPRPQH